MGIVDPWNRTAHVLAADLPLPAGGRGSWTQMVDWLLSSAEHNPFDVVLSRPSTVLIDTRSRMIPCRDTRLARPSRVRQRIRYQSYTNAIAELLKSYGRVSLFIIDAVNLKLAISRFLERSGLSDRVDITYSHHGFGHQMSAAQWEMFCRGITHYVSLSFAGYDHLLRTRDIVPFRVSVLPNPVREDVFHPIDGDGRKKLRCRLGWNEQLSHFIWLSHDRPKKGLAVVLESWRRWNSSGRPAVLHVVGVDRPIDLPGVTSHGILPHANIAPLLQAADVGIFSSLCQEGYPLSLAEMISSGCFSIASEVGGVVDFFDEPSHGLLVNRPNIVNSWVAAFDQAEKLYPGHRAQLSGRASPAFLTYPEWAAELRELVLSTGSYFRAKRR